MNLKQYKLKFYQFIYFTLNAMILPISYLQAIQAQEIEMTTLIKFTILYSLTLIFKHFLPQNKQKGLNIVLSTIFGIMLGFMSVLIIMFIQVHSIIFLKNEIDWMLLLVKFFFTYCFLLHYGEEMEEETIPITKERTPNE